jgi:hypothetical protein
MNSKRAAIALFRATDGQIFLELTTALRLRNLHRPTDNDYDAPIFPTSHATRS